MMEARADRIHQVAMESYGALRDLLMLLQSSDPVDSPQWRFVLAKAMFIIGKVEGEMNEKTQG